MNDDQIATGSVPAQRSERLDSERSAEEHIVESASAIPQGSVEAAKQRVIDLMEDALGRDAANYIHVGKEAVDALILAVQSASQQEIERLKAELVTYRTLAGIGTWHKDCRPNRQMAAREIAKGQEIINRLADRISDLEAEIERHKKNEKTMAQGSSIKLHVPDAGTEPRPNLGEVLAAANNADWQQVILNGGPPCFHFDAERGKFCLAAQRWAGHGKFHPFTGLADMLGMVVENANLSVIIGSASVSANSGIVRPMSPAPESESSSVHSSQDQEHP